MSMTVKPSELDRAIVSVLEEATMGLKRDIEKIGAEVSEKGRKELVQTSPRYTGNRNNKSCKPGAYARSWKVVKQVSGITGNSSYTIHNIHHYRLTHLLENGHVNRDGSRTRNFIHIAPVNNSVCREYERKIEDAIHDM